MKKISKILAICIPLFIVVCICLCLSIEPISLSTVNIVSDQYYHFLFLLNKKKGNSTINSIVTQTEKYDNSPLRLTKIADLITQNFSDSWWSYQNSQRFCEYNNTNGDVIWNWCSPLYGTPLYDLFDKNPGYYDYVADKIGNVTLQETNDLSFNPEWIAYQEAGNCQAISVLFNETANRSGFVTRVVRSNGLNHMWNEVNIDGNWKFFDAQRYGERSNNDPSYWYGDTKNYTTDIYDITRCGVYTLNLSKNNGGFGDDITQEYDPNFTYLHGTYDSPGCQ